MKKILLPIIAALSIPLMAGCSNPKETKAESDITTYLVLSSVGVYSGEETPKDIPELFLENTIEYKASAGSLLPGADKVSTIDESNGAFVSWVCYEDKGAPTQYTTVPNESGKILYAFYKEVIDNKLLDRLYYEGELVKTSYDLDLGETFDSTGITVYAEFNTKETVDVTKKVSWGMLKPGETSITGSYTYKNVTKYVTVEGLTITGTTTLSEITLDGGGTSLWNQASAWFAAYCWNSDGDQWFEMEKIPGTNRAVAIIDTAVYSNIIFVRMDPEMTELDWSSSWNQTVDLTFDGNYFTITGWGNGKSVGSWSTIGGSL